ASSIALPRTRFDRREETTRRHRAGRPCCRWSSSPLGSTRMLHRQVLFRSSLVRIADVSCRARRGCGTEEEAGGCQVIFVRSGVFVKRRGTQRRVAEPNTALLLNAAEPYRIEHPLDD